MSFVGVLGSRNGAEAYFEDLRRMKLNHDAKKASMAVTLVFFANSRFPARRFPWSRVEAGKIKSLRVLFNPRPLLAPAK